MTDNDMVPVIPEDIQTLLERRATYQEWLTKLVDISGDFRAEVAHRVSDDYGNRLRDVETELATHRSVLEGSLADRRTAAEELTRDHDALSAELEETELRHLVGEYGSDEYAERKEQHAGVLSELEASRDRETEAVNELETVLAEIAGAAEVSDLAAEIVEVMDVMEVVEASDQPEGPDVDVAVESEVDEVSWGEPREENVSEAVDQSTADAATEVTADDEGDETAPVPVQQTAAETPAEDADDFLDELEFLESLSIDDPVEFDSVSRLLNEEEARSGEEETSV